MRKVPLIGITGPAGAGKDTVGRHLVFEYGFAQYAFAKPIKDMLSVIGFNAKKFEDREVKEAIIPELGVSYRTMAQTLGTEWGRGLNQNFWLQIAKMHYQGLCETSFCRGLVITDVRFENEADFIRQHGTLIHLRGRSSSLSGLAKLHSSEAGIIPCEVDYTLENRKSIPDLLAAVDVFMGAFKDGQ